MKRAASAKSVAEVSRKSANVDGQHADPRNGRSSLPNAVVRPTDEPQMADEQQIREKVAILDSGAQYGKVIDRRVRECNVYSEMLPLSTTAEEIKQKDFKAIIISGGPQSVYDLDAPKYDPAIFDLGIPILGICYGFQLINQHFGGTVADHSFREDGALVIEVSPDSAIFAGLSPLQTVLLTHGDSVMNDCVAPGFEIIAHTRGDGPDRILVAGIENAEKRIYGVQFHPEVDLTKEGVHMFNNFLHSIAEISSHYTIQNREEMCIKEIRDTVGDKNVLVMVSGGVDSTVCAALLHRALGPDRVVAIHIDNGFMRHNESDDVVESLNKVGLDVKRFHCIDQFLEARVTIDEIESPPLRLVTNPEDKRRIIGDTFIRCKDEIVAQLGLNTDMFLAQGTLRPDLIESASHLASICADVIKTHHNDTALVRELRDLGKVIEPLKDFHKDEVRELGRALGLPESIVNRHPFPGPGLAIRIICAEKPYSNEFYRSTETRVSTFVKEELGPEFFTRLMPIRTVGVQGDKRTYSFAAVITTAISRIQWEAIDRCVKRIPSIAPALNRVCFAFGPPVTEPIEEITPTHLTEGVIQKLRHVDNIVTQVLNGIGRDGQRDHMIPITMHKISQMPVILIPVHLNPLHRTALSNGTIIHSVVLRPFITRDFMTGVNALPVRDIPMVVSHKKLRSHYVSKVFDTMVSRIRCEVPFISRVLLDLTSKPPGTTEWE